MRNQKKIFLITGYRLLITFCVLLSVSTPLFAQTNDAPQDETFFVETWNRIGYYDTNLERKRFAKMVGRSETKLGFNILQFPVQAYGVYYGVVSQDAAYWNNSLFSGGGIRFIPFRDFKGTHWVNEWLKGTRFYYETLSSSYMVNGDQAQAAGLYTTDVRNGIEVYHEWNLDNPDETKPWAEMWGNLSYRSTNFTSWETGSRVLYLQPKFGIHLGGGIGVYLLADVISSTDDSYWLNTTDYGVGIRFEPWRQTGAPNDLFRKFKMFLEAVGLSYTKDRPTDPNNDVTSDVRFGVEFTYGR